jgi:hypothetical protein
MTNRRPTALVVGAVCMALSACSLHVAKGGVSGNVFGHSFSAAQGSLPAGFPTGVPTPDHSRVLDGGGASGRWDVAFAVTGDLATGTTAYQDKFRATGYAVTDVQAGTTPVTGPTGAASGSTATTVTVSGSTFRATNSQWTVMVESGSTTAATGTPLKQGEFGINITAVPTSSMAPSSP